MCTLDEQKDMLEFFNDLIMKLEETSNEALKTLIKSLFGGVITNLVISHTRQQHEQQSRARRERLQWKLVQHESCKYAWQDRMQEEAHLHLVQDFVVYTSTHTHKSCKYIYKMLLELTKRIPHSNSSVPPPLENEILCVSKSSVKHKLDTGRVLQQNFVSRQILTNVFVYDRVTDNINLR